MNRLLLALVCLVFISGANAEIELESDQSATHVAENIYFLREPTASIDDVITLRDQFQRNTRSVFNLGLLNEPIWLRIPVKNQGEKTGNWVFSLNFAAFDFLQVYWVAGNTKELLFDYEDTAQREASYYTYRTIAFPLELEARESGDIFLQFQAPNSSMPISILTSEAHNERVVEKFYLYVSVFGVLVTLFLFTMVPLLLSGLQMFVFYPLGQFILFLLCLHFDGMTTAYLWPENPTIGRMLISQGGVAYVVVLLVFSRTFFGLKDRSPMLEKFITGVIYLGLAFLAYSFFGFFVAELDRRLTSIPAIIISLTAWIVLPSIAIYGTIKWDFYFWPIALAWTLFTTFSIGVILVITGIVDEPFFGRYYYAFLVLVEAICLWAALMLRVKRVHHDSLAMQVQLEHSLARQKEETKRSQNLLSQKSVALQEASEKSKLLLATGHDARQVVSALKNYAFGLVNSNSREKELGQRINDLATHLDATLTTAIEGSYGGAMEDSIAAVEEIDLHHLMTTLQLIHENSAREKNLSFRTFSSSRSVVTDKALLMRVLSNFLSNAIKYTDEGGLLFGCRSRAGRIVFQVWDTGTGLSEEQVKKTSEFPVLSKGFNDSQQGLGAGLAICAMLAQRLHANIAIRSTPSRGSVFELQLPPVPVLNESVVLLGTAKQVDFLDCIQLDTVDQLAGLSVDKKQIILVDQQSETSSSLAEIFSWIKVNCPDSRVFILALDRNSATRTELAPYCDGIVYRPITKASLAVAAQLAGGTFKT